MNPKLSPEAKAAVPEIAAWLRRRADDHRTKTVKTALWVAALELEETANKEGKR